MPQAITISLKDITKAIDKAARELTAASKKTRDRRVKQDLSKKVEKLKGIEASVKVLCQPTPINPPTHFLVIPLE